MTDETSITLKTLEWAKDRILMGTERKSAVLSEENRKLTAYHEAGHALVALKQKVRCRCTATIVPRGQALGMVTQLPDKDETSISRRQLLARLDVCFGGRVAEEIIFGQDEVTGSSQRFTTSNEISALHGFRGWDERQSWRTERRKPPWKGI